MSHSNSLRFGVPIRLIKNGKIVVETRGDSHWASYESNDAEVIDAFLDYMVSVREDLLKNPSHKILTDDYDFLEIAYKDHVIRYPKAHIVSSPILEAA